jgi:hypothetical protein
MPDEKKEKVHFSKRHVQIKLLMIYLCDLRLPPGLQYEVITFGLLLGHTKFPDGLTGP